MGRGIYTAASGLLTTEGQMAKAAENLVNLETKGYKSSQLEVEGFEPYVLQIRKGSKTEPLSECFDGVHLSQVRTDFSSGEIEETQRNLDFAIVGPGFFRLEGTGTILTRGGSFHIDIEGYLAHENGKRVMGEDGPILLKTDVFALEEGGKIVSLDGETLGRIALYSAEDDALTRTDSNCFLAAAVEEVDLTDSNTSLVNRALEASNVDRQSELISMAELSKQHSIYAQALGVHNKLDEEVNSKILG